MPLAKRLRSLGINVLVMLASLVAFFGLAEGLARLAGYTPYETQMDAFHEQYERDLRESIDLFVFDPLRVWDLQPGFVGHRDDWGNRNWVTIAINSQGRRDKEVTLKKPENTYRIAILGDSVGFGARVGVKDNFATQMEWNLNARSSSLRYEVLNFSVPGYGTWQELSTLKDKALAYDPDTVILAFVMNDFVSNNQAGARGYLSMTRLEGVAKFLREQSAFYRFMREKVLSVEARMTLRDPCAGADENFCWETTEQLLDQIHDVTRQHNIQFVLLIFPVSSQTLVAKPKLEERYQQVLVNYAHERDIPVIDLLKALSEHSDEELFIDDYHPNEQGHAIVTIELLEQLELQGVLPKQ
jgi:lysophospholipase L1-like esterase